MKVCSCPGVHQPFRVSRVLKVHGAKSLRKRHILIILSRNLKPSWISGLSRKEGLRLIGYTVGPLMLLVCIVVVRLLLPIGIGLLVPWTY